MPVGRGAGERLVEAQARDQRLGPGDHDQRASAARIERRRDLALELRRRDQLVPAARAQAGVLREGLVLDDHGRSAGRDVARDRVVQVDRVAIAGVQVGDDRQGDRRGHASRGLQVLGQAHDAGVGHAQRGRKLEAAGPDGVEARLLDQPGAQGVVRRHGGDEGLRFEGVAEDPRRGLVHRDTWHR